jgi:hypothetical protein
VREPYTEKTKLLSNKEIKIWLWAPLGSRHQDELADRPSVAVVEIELASLHCKLQTRPLVREGDLHEK